MMRLLVLLLFAGGVYFGGLWVGPVYRNYLETGLTVRTAELLEEKGLRGVKVSYDYLSVKASGNYEPGKVAREIDKGVWGAYVAPNAVKGSLKAPSKLVISVDRQSGKVILRGTVPDSSLRKTLQQAVKSAGAFSEVDNILLIDDSVASPSWKNAVAGFIRKFLETPGTTRLTLNDIDGLKLEGTVEFQKIKDRLEKAGASFSRVENLLEVGRVKEFQKR